MMKRSKSVFWMAVMIIVCSSCEKVIDVKLNDSTVQVVIEGEITNARGPYKVTVSGSKNFEENNTFPGHDDAVVVIKDLTSGISETLEHTGSGAYQTAGLQGIGGHAYQLTVTLNNKVYEAVSTIPLKNVKLDRLSVKTFEFDSDDIFMVPTFTDPVGKGNYYRIRQWVNGTLIKGSYVRSDEATDGLTYDSELYYSTDEEDGNPLIHNGDSITAELQCVDKGVYDFYRTLNSTIDQDSATPANPLSNISGGALGVFNACRSVKLSAAVKY